MTLQERMNGKLPEIDIAGTMFFVDIQKGELRADDGLNSHIKFSDMQRSPFGNSYRFSFNPETKQMIDIQPEIKEWPAGTLIIEIPDQITMDPYGWAMEQELDPVEFMKTHSFSEDLKGKIILLEKTGYPAQMQKNKMDEEQLLQRKNRVRNKRNGKGI